MHELSYNVHINSIIWQKSYPQNDEKTSFVEYNFVAIYDGKKHPTVLLQMIVVLHFQIFNIC